MQVICKDWSNLAGKNYIILNMTENIDCVSAELGGGRKEGWRRAGARGMGGGLSLSVTGASLTQGVNQHPPMSKRGAPVYF